jgi:hypothetical protein
MSATISPLRLTATGIALAIPWASLPAQAITLGFDSVTTTSNTFVAVGPSYSEQGFTLIDNSGFAPPSVPLATWGASSAGYTGSQSLFNNGIDQTTTLTKDGGGVFSLNSIDLSELFNNGLGSVTVSFLGYLLGGGTVTQSFTTDGVFGAETFTFDSTFASVASVTWRQDAPFHQFDNIVVDATFVNAAVPEPSSVLGLLSFGIIGGAASIRRRRFNKLKANSRKIRFGREVTLDTDNP